MYLQRIFWVLLQALLLYVWVVNYPKEQKKQLKLTRRNLLHLLSLNLWLLLFVMQVLLGPILTISEFSPLMMLFGNVIYTIGVLVSIIARLSLGKSWGLPIQYDKPTQAGLRKTGIYRYSRNPIYFSELLMVFGFELAMKSALIVLVIPFYYWNKTKAKKEEVLLEETFGGEYEEYKRKVPRFISYRIFLGKK